MKIPVMMDDQVLKTLQEDFGVDFVFDDVDRLMESCESTLDEVKQHVTDATEMQLQNFHAHKDAIMKYRKETNFQLNKQEKSFLEKSAGLSEANNNLQREISSIKADIKNFGQSKTEKHRQLTSLEQKLMHHLKIHDANVQSLEETRKSVASSMFFYNFFLGMDIRKDASSDNQFRIELKTNYRKLEADCKISVTESNDGFVFPDGSTASTPFECMKRLCDEKKTCFKPTSQI